MAPPGKPNTRNNSSSDSLSIDEKLNLLLSDVSQIKNESQQSASDIAEIKREIVQFKEDINKSLDMCFNEINDCKVNISNNSKALNGIEHSMEVVKNENLLLKKTVSDLRRRLSAAEQYSRSNCLEIVGVPEVPGENVFMVVRQVASVLGFKLEDSMVDAVHRLSKNVARPSEPRSIIVKFCRRIDMEEMRRRSRVKRSFSAAELGLNSENKIFVNLSLSKETRQLWTEVKNFKQRCHYKYAWITSAGKIFIRKDQGQPAVLITEVADLNSLK
jgi:hypothetical protein